MTAPGLLPCPFCGGEAKISLDHTVEENHAYGCPKCNIWFDKFNSENAEAEWNTRAAPPASPVVQEIVAEAVKAEREALQSMAKDRASSLKDACKGWDSDKYKTSFTGGVIELVAFAAAIRARGEG